VEWTRRHIVLGATYLLTPWLYLLTLWSYYLLTLWSYYLLTHWSYYLLTGPIIC